MLRAVPNVIAVVSGTSIPTCIFVLPQYTKSPIVQNLWFAFWLFHGAMSNPQREFEIWSPIFWAIRGKYFANDSIFSDRLHILNSIIPVFSHVVTTFPRANPMRIGCIQALASTLNERYHVLGHVDDLGQSTLQYTEAIFLPRHWDKHFPNIAHNFLLIAQLLLLRAAHTEHPEDVKHPVIYLRHLCGLSFEAFNISPDMVKEHLVCSLALQVRLGLGDVMRDIQEMTALILELLNFVVRTVSTGTITSFAEVIRIRHGSLGKGKELPAKVIDCLRKAKIRLPDSDELSITLARTLLDRFRVCIAYSNDDYEEGTAVLDKILSSHAPGNEPSQYREASQLISLFAQV